MLITSNEARYDGWVCAGLSLFILIIRVITARVRHCSFDISTLICIVSMLAIGARIAVNQFILSYGTANDALHAKSHYFDSHNLETLKVGSILALIARLLDTTFYWLQTSLLLLFYSRIFEVRAHWITILIRISWIALPLTYIAVVLATFLECHPFKLYWQVEPNPGQCVRAYIQLLTQCIANILLDLSLLAISSPLILVRNRTLFEKIRLGLLYCLGFFCIVVTCVRISYIYAEASYQPVRSFWASVQILVSTFVANVPTIYGCVKLINRRKSEQCARRGSRPEVWLQVQTSSESNPSSVFPILSRQRTGSPKASEKGWPPWMP